MWPDELSIEDAQTRAWHAAYRRARNRFASHDWAQQLADEATQEALAQFLHVVGTGQICDARHARHWLIRAACQRVDDHFRSEGIRQRHQQAVYKRLVEIRQLASTLQAAVFEALKDLPDSDRVLLEDYYYEGLTLEELAERHLPDPNRSLPARQQAIHRRLRRLRESLRPALSEWAPAPVTITDSRPPRLARRRLRGTPQ